MSTIAAFTSFFGQVFLIRPFLENEMFNGIFRVPQPFGGSRASGTNDKAGSWLNLERWVTPRTIKETFLPPTDFKYPYMSPK